MFKVAFERWVGTPGDEDPPSLTSLVREALDDLRAVTHGG